MWKALPARAWLCIGCLTLLAPGPLSGQMGLREVTSLRFEGNHQFSDRALASSIITRETDCRSFIFYPFCLAGAGFALDPYLFSEREFRRDNARVRLFYWMRGFREAVVDTVVTRSGDDQVQILFKVQEGEPIRAERVAFEVDGELPDSAVLEDLPMKEGEPLSLVALDATRDTVETRLKNQGFAHAEVLLRYGIDSETPHSADVTFEVYPGPLTRYGPLNIHVWRTDGRQPTVDEPVVRRLLPFRQGDVYREYLQFAGQRTLYNLDIFRYVSVARDSLAPVDSILPMSVQLEEGDIHNVRAGGGLSTAECFNVEARWGSRNFHGGARRLQITGRVSNILTGNLKGTALCGDAGSPKTDEYDALTGSVSLDFTQPWFFSRRNSVSATLFAERQSIPDIFVQEAVGMGLGITHALTPNTLFGVSYRPRLSRLDSYETFFCSAYLICDLAGIDALSGENLLSPVGVSISQDRRDQILNPTRGSYALVDVEKAAKWSFSDFRYTRLISEVTWHVQGPVGGVVAMRVRGGWVGSQGFRGLSGEGASSELVHPEKRLFAGGANSVRGFPQNGLGPQVLYLNDPSKLEDPGLGSDACTEASIEDRSCDPGPLAQKDRGAFDLRPLGGTRLLEGGVELRVPVSGSLWENAVFVDFGQVWNETSSPSLEVTPGVGVRYFSPIGPIRVDLAYRLGGGQDLSVLTPRPSSEKELVFLEKKVRWNADLSRWSASRFQLHLSIGQAF